MLKPGMFGIPNPPSPGIPPIPGRPSRLLAPLRWVLGFVVKISTLLFMAS
jgi:hypothetical protein